VRTEKGISSVTCKAASPDTTPESSLRPARSDDYDFAARLYFEEMKPLLVAIGQWNEDQAVARFKAGFRPEQSQVLCSGGTDIGWIQLDESDTRLHLDQLHIIADFRNRGIGTRLVQGLIERARQSRKELALNVVRGNRAIGLYLRLGFHVVGGDEAKLQMRWVRPTTDK
jgi:ribosomal protein S18 acetylase RimI-like enzyme